jgi:prevent-host-death family protein
MIILSYFGEGGQVPRTLSAARAKAEFAECVRKAETGEAIVITRHGRPVAALVRADEVKQLERLRAAGPETGLAGLAGGWTGSQDFVTAVASIRRSPPRGPRRRRS